MWNSWSCDSQSAGWAQQSSASPHGSKQYHSAVRLLLVAYVCVTQRCQYQCGSGSRGRQCQAAGGSFCRCDSLSVLLSELRLHSSATLISGLHVQSICALCPLEASVNPPHWNICDHCTIFWDSAIAFWTAVVAEVILWWTRSFSLVHPSHLVDH